MRSLFIFCLDFLILSSSLWSNLFYILVRYLYFLRLIRRTEKEKLVYLPA